MSVSFLFLFQSILIVFAHVLNPEPRIISGYKTRADEYPWIVSIQWRETSEPNAETVATCTGTLIRNTYPAAVLTAGHCVGPRILGDWGRTFYADINRTHPYNPVNASNDSYISLRAFYYYTTTEYESQSSSASVNLLTDYDFGILLLDGSVENVLPITLYNPNSTEHASKCCSDDQIVRVFGYGYVNDNYKKTESLRYLDMKYMENVHECSDSVVQCVEDNDSFNREFKDVVVNDGSAICAQADNAGICQGDSGGPLVYVDENGKVIQIGISSQSCCIEGVPNMFASVPFFYDEIQRILEDKTTWIEYVNKTYQNEDDKSDDDTSQTVNKKLVLCTVILPLWLSKSLL